MTKITIPSYQVHSDLSPTENLLFNFINFYRDKRLAIQHARLFAARSWVNRSYTTLLQRGYFNEHAHQHADGKTITITLTPIKIEDTLEEDLDLPEYKLHIGRKPHAR